jgi:hypothetical protein
MSCLIHKLFNCKTKRRQQRFLIINYTDFYSVGVICAYGTFRLDGNPRIYPGAGNGNNENNLIEVAQYLTSP